MTNKPTKAIIPVAGWGTRRLPITKSIEKCMLPVGNRPLVDYVVQDCIRAGLTDIYFVVGEQSSQLHDFYRNNVDLNDYLRRSGKSDMLPLVAPPKIRLHYVVQSSYGNYGTAIPVSLVFDELEEGESVVVLMGDDFIFRPDGESEVARLIEMTPPGQSGMLAAKVAYGELSKYGVVEVDAQHNFKQIVEKPEVTKAHSNLINISKYLLNYEIMRLIKQYAATEQPDEYYITEPINQAVASGEVIKVVPAEGQYLDGGTVEGWLKANQVVLSS